jgi:glutamyl endopeptidase
MSNEDLRKLISQDCLGNSADYDFSNITPKYFVSELRQEAVCGPDERIKVTDTSVMPYKAICKLYMRSTSGKNYVGTGWLTHSNKLYTAGHCVYDHDEGGWMSSIIVVPAKSGNSEPFGRYTASSMRATNGWINNKSQRYDMGAIKLASSVSHGDNISPSLADANSATICGYPADRDTGIFQYKMLGSVTKRDDRFFYQIDTFGGQSGCPVLENNNRAIGIHNYGGCDNSGSDLYQQFVDDINKW